MVFFPRNPNKNHAASNTPSSQPLFTLLSLRCFQLMVGIYLWNMFKRGPGIDRTHVNGFRRSSLLSVAIGCMRTGLVLNVSSSHASRRPQGPRPIDINDKRKTTSQWDSSKNMICLRTFFSSRTSIPRFRE